MRTGRWLVPVVVVIAGAAVGTSARASTCDTSWTGNAGDGLYSTAGNWSAGVPSGNNGCITLAGTYTVHVQNTPPTATTLTVGAASGTQTLSVESTCSAHATLTTSAGLTVGSHGAVLLTNADGCGDNATIVGAVTNGGALTSVQANGGARTIQGALSNSGTLTIARSLTYNGSSTTLTNTGTITIADGQAISISNSSSFTNGTGGSITASGMSQSGQVFEQGGTFTQGAGTATGTEPVVIDDGTLSYTGAGASVIGLRGSTTLSGSLSSGQSLSIESTCSEHAIATAGASFTNAGTITMTNADGCGDNATLSITSGTFTNSATINVVAANGGARSLLGNMNNTGTVNVHRATSMNVSGTTFTNSGTLNVDNGVTVTVNGGASFTNGSTGSIAATGSGQVFETNGTFTQNGAASGSAPVLVQDASLVYSTTQTSAVTMIGSTNTLSGNLASGQSLTLESTCSEHVSATDSSSFSNAGTITMTNGDSCGDNATLAISSGTLTNTGTITTVAANGGTRNFQGNINNSGTMSLGGTSSFDVGATSGTGNFTNTGTVTFTGNSTYRPNGSTLTNVGTINVADGDTIAVNNGASFLNSSGATVAANGTTHSGSIFETGGTFTQNGTVTGTKPIFVDDGTLNYGSTQPSSIGLRGADTLSGNMPAGQSVSIESTCSEHAAVTANASFTNAGTIAFTNADGCGDNATLAVSSGTLTNTGTLNMVLANGGARTLQGNLSNTGTINVHQSTTYNAAGTTFTNGGKLNLDTGVTLSVTGGASFSDGAPAGTVTATGTGQIAETGGTFTQAKGVLKGTKPVLLDDASLTYTGTGSGLIRVHGTITLTGNLSGGQALQLESTCSEHAVVNDVSNLTNAGTLTLTNGDGCGDNVSINLNSGAGTLTNKGTIAVLASVGGTRNLSGSLVQMSTGKYQTSVSPNGVLNVSGSQTLAGTYIPKPHPTKATVGQTFQVIQGTVSGTFATESGGNINATGFYYQPTYPVAPNCSGGFASCVVLVVHKATMALSSTTVAPGGMLTVSGSGWPATDSLTITFTDANKTKTTYPAVPTDGSGNFSTMITIPGGAAAGTGKVLVTSGLTGAQVSKSVTVS